MGYCFIYPGFYRGGLVSIMAGVDTRVIEEILGHASIVQTRAYQRVNHTLATAALNNVATLLEGDES